MKITEPELKSFIYDTITYTDDLDDKGNRIKRLAFKKEHFKAYKTIDKKLTDSIVVWLAVDSKKREELTQEDLIKVSLNDYLADRQKYLQGRQFVGEVFSDSEIEFNENELKAIRFFFEEKTSIGNLKLDLYEKFENLINV